MATPVLWGYCDKCDAHINVGDSCWVERGYAIDEAMTFCGTCWDNSTMSKAQRNDIRNVTIKGRRGPSVISAVWCKVE